MLNRFTKDNARKKQFSFSCTPRFKISTFAISRLGFQNLSKLCAAALIALFFLSFIVEAAAAEILPASRQANMKQAENQTMELARLMARYRHAGEENKAILLNEMVDQAMVRQTLLGELVQTDPLSAMRAILPEKVRTGMPNEVQQLLMQKQVFQGELEVFYEDYEDGRHKLRHVLKTQKGIIELKLAEHAGVMQSGMWVSARGWLFKHGDETIGSLVLNDSPDSLELLADGAVTTTTTAGQAVLPNTLGEQRTLVLLVNFQDNPVQPWTLKQAEQMVFGTVNDFFLENSYGQTWLAGDVYGYYTLPIDSVCDTYDIETHAKQAAAVNGIDTSSYSRLIYIFPQISDCGWTGKGTVVGNPSRAWINGSLELRTIGHELGHNLGLQHAKRLECGVDIIGGDCYTVEYGDSLDIMGSPGFTGNFNAFNKELLGWLNDDSSTASGQIIAADMDGSYQLEPYEIAPGNAPKALKILRGIDSVSGQRLWYYLEFRQPLGFDTYLASYPAITKGALFHLGIENDTNSSQWIDMTPASASADWNDAVLPVKDSYTDFEAGVSITTVRADASGASFNISFAGASCIPSSPALSLFPSESAWVSAGTTVTYLAAVTNRDSIGCEASDFSVTAELPPGWDADSASLNLPPGASATVTLSVTSAQSAINGFYDILIRAQKSSDSNYQNNEVVTYVVDTPAPACVAANPELLLSAVDGKPVEAGTAVTYSATVTNKDSSSCEASLFDVSAKVPEGWSSTSYSFKLGPGESATVSIAVTSTASATDGLYAIDINTQNLMDDRYYSSAAATYSITTPMPACETATPLLSLSTDISTEVAAGTTVLYHGTVINRDSSGCDASDFEVFADLPAGWNAESATVNLAPGADAPVAINVTSPTDAEEGVYYIVINAKNTANAFYTDNNVVSYLVAAPPNSAPVAVNDTVRLTDKNAIEIDVMTNDTDADGDPLTVIEVTQGAQGSVQIISDGSLIYTPDKNFKGSDSFGYIVSDGKRTAAATVIVSLVKKNSK